MQLQTAKRRADRTGANNHFVNNLIDGPKFTHIFNGGFLTPVDARGAKTTRSKALKLIEVPSYILVRHDKNAWKYDAKGKRRPESLPVHRRRMM